MAPKLITQMNSHVRKRHAAQITRIPYTSKSLTFRFALAQVLFGIFPFIALSHAQAQSPYQAPAWHCAAPPNVYEHTRHANPSTLIDILREAKSGDALELSSGNYGDLIIKGVNSGYIKLYAGKGQTPHFDSIRIGGASRAAKWSIQGMVVTGLPKGGAKIMIVNSSNIDISGNVIATFLDGMPWVHFPKGQAVTGVASGVDTENSDCITIYGNMIKNVFNGIAAGGDQIGNNGHFINIAQNDISFFAGDGIDFYGSDMRINKNRITNGLDVCDDMCVHNDGIQGWNYHDKAGIVNSNITISSNIVIARVVRALPFEADDLHGITIFNGNWRDVTIENNIVITPAWHGITVYGGQSINIIHNTVISPSKDRAAWILLAHQKGDNPNLDVHDLVAYNVAGDIINGKGGSGAVNGAILRANLIVDNPKHAFEVFDPASGNYDVRFRRLPPESVGSTEVIAPSQVGGAPSGH